MIVADIEAPVILGYDFMYDHNCALDIRNASLKIGEAQIQCNREGQEGYIYVFRIRLESDVTVPPGCEMMVRGKVDAENFDISQITEAFVESKTESVLVKQGIMVVKALVDPSSGTEPLRLMNLTDKHQFLRSKSIAATADIVQNVISLDSEHPLTDLTPIRSL